MQTTNVPNADIKELLEQSIQESDLLSSHLSSNSLSALYAMAYELYRGRKYEDAKAFFRFLTLTFPSDYKYWMGLAACYQMLKCYAEAVDCYSIAAIQNPLDPYIHWHAADCFFHSDKMAEANDALDAAMQIAQENESYQTLIPKLALISQVWSNSSTGSHSC